MKNWDKYTDKDNVDFAAEEYGSVSIGDPYVIGDKNNKRVAGYVQAKLDR